MNEMRDECFKSGRACVKRLCVGALTDPFSHPPFLKLSLDSNWDDVSRSAHFTFAVGFPISHRYPTSPCGSTLWDRSATSSKQGQERGTLSTCECL